MTLNVQPMHNHRSVQCFYRVVKMNIDCEYTCDQDVSNLSRERREIADEHDRHHWNVRNDAHSPPVKDMTSILPYASPYADSVKHPKSESHPIGTGSFFISHCSYSFSDVITQSVFIQQPGEPPCRS